MLANSIVLAISGREDLRPLGILFRPFANGVCVGKRMDKQTPFKKSGLGLNTYQTLVDFRELSKSLLIGFYL